MEDKIEIDVTGLSAGDIESLRRQAEQLRAKANGYQNGHKIEPNVRPEDFRVVPGKLKGTEHSRHGLRE